MNNIEDHMMYVGVFHAALSFGKTGQFLKSTLPRIYTDSIQLIICM